MKFPVRGDPQLGCAIEVCPYGLEEVAMWFEPNADRHAPERPADSKNISQIYAQRRVKRGIGHGPAFTADRNYAAERIHEALLYPLSTFDATTLPADGTRRVVFHCGSGKGSLTAAERRLAAGHGHAAHMGGGIAAWKAAVLPVTALSGAA